MPSPLASVRSGEDCEQRDRMLDRKSVEELLELRRQAVAAIKEERENYEVYARGKGFGERILRLLFGCQPMSQMPMGRVIDDSHSAILAIDNALSRKGVDPRSIE